MNAVYKNASLEPDLRENRLQIGVFLTKRQAYCDVII